MEKLSNEGQLFLSLSVGEKAVVADFDEALGEDVEEKATDELQSIEGHDVLAVSLSVVLPTKGDPAFVQRDQTLVGDSDAVGVASEVLENLMGAAEGRFGIDDPVFGAGDFPPASPGGSTGQGLELAMEGEFSLVEGLLEIAEELASKQTAQGTDGEEETGTSGDPSSTVPGQPSARDHPVHMGVMEQVLAPGVQHEQKTDVCSEMLRIPGEGEEALRRGAKKNGVHLARVL
jgi:hypothetical protein